MQLFLNIILLLLGFFLLIKGADFFVEGASDIAVKFRIPQMVIGLTIVAFGTSAPEAAISIGAAVKGSESLAIGNIIGSNIINIWLILGVTALITPLLVKKNTVKYEIPFVIFITLLLTVMGAVFKKINLFCGIALLLLMAAFMVYLIRMSKKGEGEDDENEHGKKPDEIKAFRVVIMSVLGLAGIVVGANVTVDSATYIAEFLGMSERFIGLTVVAFGTSLPELVTSVTAAVKGKNDIAVGNIVGSNIFNILFVIGITAVLSPVAFESNFIIDGIIAVAAALTLLIFSANKEKKIKRYAGVIMLVMFCIYFAYLLFVH